MIVIDNNYEINGTIYRRTMSNANLMIRKTGTDEIYSDAVDLLTSTWEYEETDIPIDLPTIENEVTDF